eukprot:CAMPEP_0185725270 /NCGR_PEP_ID=MMETSP1171-20130828/1563_1 /TAXON_ID=374046 /ORGANISM="Helicotheca tamensis, Strain CCMP826" /LENGTH=279 /DNA_ID=CAMNT_0028393347 /DNA_START=126 /DNA_END=965 /DNA_ORIENTATION=-
MTLAALVEATVEPQPLKVIYAGMGRFGTTSLAEALARLGYKVTHGSIIAKDLRGAHADLGHALMSGNVDKILSHTSQLGYNATVGSHNLFWREMMERTPGAKIIFMTRDFESWFASLGSMLNEIKPLLRYPLRLIPSINAVAQYTDELTKRTFEREHTIDEINEIERNPDGALSKQAYKQQYDVLLSDMERVLRDHPDQAFLFHKKDGYPSLCKILEISDEDCPDEPFPHANAVKRHKHAIFIMEVVAYILIFVALKLSVSAFVRMTCGTKNDDPKKTK